MAALACAIPTPRGSGVSTATNTITKVITTRPRPATSDPLPIVDQRGPEATLPYQTLHQVEDEAEVILTVFKQRLLLQLPWQPKPTQLPHQRLTPTTTVAIPSRPVPGAEAKTPPPLASYQTTGYSTPTLTGREVLELPRDRGMGMEATHITWPTTTVIYMETAI